jgi:hypothetical protein
VAIPGSAMLSNKKCQRTLKLRAVHKLSAHGLFLPDKIVQAIRSKCLA